MRSYSHHTVEPMPVEAYPFSYEEDVALAAMLGGPELVDDLHLVMSTTSDGPWRANSVGGNASPHCQDLRIAPVIPDKFSIVYWGGEGAETIKLWSFQITRFRPNATAFDPDQDGPVSLSEEKLRLLVDTISGRFELEERILFASEGSVVWLEYTPDNAPQQTIPITFPFRRPPPDVGGIRLA